MDHAQETGIWREIGAQEQQAADIERRLDVLEGGRRRGPAFPFLVGLTLGLFLCWYIADAAYQAGKGAGHRAGYWSETDTVECSEQRI